MSEKVKDLVCGMEFDQETASRTFEYRGKTYYFCSLGCEEKFTQNADKYAAHEEKGES